MIWQLEITLFLFLLISAIVALESKDLLVAVVMMTIFSFLMALLFVTMGAVDVGFTEAVVGAGVSYRISSIEDNFDNVPFADNDNIELEADKILDFSEKNPFGEF